LRGRRSAAALFASHRFAPACLRQTGALALLLANAGGCMSAVTQPPAS